MKIERCPWAAEGFEMRRPQEKGGHTAVPILRAQAGIQDTGKRSNGPVN